MTGSGPRVVHHRAHGFPSATVSSRDRSCSKIAVSEVELTEGLKSLQRRRQTSTNFGDPVPALTLIRLHSQPIGTVALNLHDEHANCVWPQIVSSQLKEDLDRHLTNDNCESWTDRELWEGIRGDVGIPPCLHERQLALADAPFATVVVATRGRSSSLARCVESLLRLDYPQFEIVIVDNDPPNGETKEMVALRFAHEEKIRYVRENRRGLSAAHNRGICVASGTIIAFTDDDVIVDKHWLSDLVTPFAADPRVAGATGLILPAELETSAQIMLELHGNFSKGFATKFFDCDVHRPNDPLFPFRAGTLGSGANMAFSTSYLQEIGGFDTALGAGTPAKGGDDLAALCRLILSGKRLAYRPAAIVWHHHHRDLEAVKRQAYGYGVGFTAYLASVGMHEPREVLPYLRHMPIAIAEIFRRSKHHSTVLESLLASIGDVPEWPRSLWRLQIQGMLNGAPAYLRSRYFNGVAVRSSRDVINA